MRVKTPCAPGQVVKWNGSKWVCAADLNSGGTVTTVNSGTGLAGGPIATSGTLSLDTVFTDGRYGRTGNPNLVVDCNAGGSIAAALAQAEAWVGPVRITILGTCTESVSITRSNVTLKGTSSGPGVIQAPTPAADVLQVRDAQEVHLENVVLRGGFIGLRVNQATVDVGESQVTNNGFHGVFVTAGSVRFWNTTIENNSGSGVFGWVGSRVLLTGSILRNNHDGIGLHSNSTVQVGSGSAVSGNAENGVGLSGNCVADLRDVTIEGNQGDGVNALAGSTVLFGGPALVRDNRYNGVHLSDTSVVLGFSPGARIRDHLGWGIACDPPPAVAQIGQGTSIQYDNNGQGSTNCPVN